MYKPTIGAYPDPSQPRRFDDSSRFDNISLSVTPVELLETEGAEAKAHGTGFFWASGEEQWLVTNWHNVTGLSPFTLDPLGRLGIRPRWLRIYVPRRTVAGQHHYLERCEKLLPLYKDDAPLWFVCPEFETLRTDIVALRLPINAVDPGYTIDRYNVSELLHLVGNEVFVVGYPFRNYGGIMLPVWKRGSFATDPIWPIDKKPMVLIDAATRAGMSGSPVFARRFGPAAMKDLSIKMDRISSTEFVGVYSSHLGTSLDEITIGMVWYSTLVERLLASRTPGKRS